MMHPKLLCLNCKPSRRFTLRCFAGVLQGDLMHHLTEYSHVKLHCKRLHLQLETVSLPSKLLLA